MLDIFWRISEFMTVTNPSLSIESAHLFLEQLTGASKAACMTSRLYPSLCLMLSITGLLGGIVALGDSIRALCGEILENWPSRV